MTSAPRQPSCRSADHFQLATLANVARLLENLAGDRPADAEVLTRSAAVIDEIWGQILEEHVTVHGCDIADDVRFVRAVDRFTRA